MSNANSIESLETYFNLMTVNGSAYVFNIAHKMKIFAPFHEKEHLTSEEVSRTLGYTQKPVELILNTLCTLNVMNKEDQGYTLAPVTKLLTGNYSNLSSDYWEHLPTYLMEGTPYKKMDSEADSEKEYQVQVKSLEWMMTPSANLSTEVLKEITEKENLKILDVGAGSGVWSYSFLYKNSTATTTLADWPAVLEVAKDTAKTKSISDRVSYIEGNYHETNFDDGYDLAIIANVTHIETEEGCRKLFDKVSKSLKPGGKLLIFDSYGDDSRGDLARGLYELGLAIRTISGEVHRPETLKSWMSDYSFSNFDFKSLDITPYTMGVLIGEKVE